MKSKHDLNHIKGNIHLGITEYSKINPTKTIKYYDTKICLLYLLQTFWSLKDLWDYTSWGDKLDSMVIEELSLGSFGRKIYRLSNKIKKHVFVDLDKKDLISRTPSVVHEYLIINPYPNKPARWEEKSNDVYGWKVLNRKENKWYWPRKEEFELVNPKRFM
jgi:hypothetical protein